MRPDLLFAVIFIAFQSLDAIPPTQYHRQNFFDIDLLKYIAEKPGNVIVSPASVKSTLAILLEGAKGETASEIKSTLRLSPVEDDFRKEINIYLKALQVNTSGAILHSANGLFASNKLKLKKDYETILKKIYFTNVNSMNFSNPSAAAEFINGWVNSETKGLISSIVEEIYVNPSTEMIVANALYFKSSWVHGFDPKLTHESCFYKDGVCKNVAMMELREELNYAYIDSLRAHAVELPYKGGRYSMILLVPQDRAAVFALIRDLPYVGLHRISEVMEPTDIILSLPKFTLDYGDDIVAPLKKTGILSLFSSKSNLSGIFEGPSPFINSVQHCIHLEVNEEGTVAAAVTGGLVIPLTNSQVQLQVDRPFLFFIRDNSLGLMVFEGRIEDLSESVDQDVLKDQKKHQVSIEVAKRKDESDVPKKREESEVLKRKDESEFSRGKEESEVLKKKYEIEFPREKEESEVLKRKDEIEFPRRKEESEVLKRKDEIEFPRKKEESEVLKRKDEIEFPRKNGESAVLTRKDDVEFPTKKDESEVLKRKAEIIFPRREEESDVLIWKEEMEFPKKKEESEVIKSKDESEVLKKKDESERKKGIVSTILSYIF